MGQLFRLGSTAPRLADSAWVAPNAVLIGEVILHGEASVWFGVTLRADDEPIEIGARSNVQDLTAAHVDPGFPLTIGEDCTIGHQVMLHGCTIGDNSLIGMGATIMNGVTIGRNCLIGAGALIPEGKTIPDNSLVMGAPGKVVREIDDEGAKRLTVGAEIYLTRKRRYAAELCEVTWPMREL